MTLMEYILQSATQAARGRKCSSSKGQSKPGSSVGCKTVPANEFPLVLDDNLFVRVVPAAPASGPGKADGQNSCDPAEVARMFRTTFSSVWGQIPEADRQPLLDHWRRGPDRGLYDERAEWGHHWPLIQIVGAGPQPPHAIYEKMGNVLNFPAALITAHPHLLGYEIGRILAQVYRLATCEHWRLIQEVLEQPLERWERQEGARATEARLNKKVKSLETAYLQQYEARITQIVRSWGIKEPEGTPQNTPASV